jgi:hypothetical protein
MISGDGIGVVAIYENLGGLMVAVIWCAAFTHPDIASLVTPLFAFGGKRVVLKSIIILAEYILSLSLFPACGREGG